MYLWILHRSSSAIAVAYVDRIIQYEAVIPIHIGELAPSVIIFNRAKSVVGPTRNCKIAV